MLLQTNSYIVPKEKRHQHQRLIRRFRQTLRRLGCEHFEVYEQVGPNWASSEASGRYVQILRFTDRKHQLAVQQAERSDPAAQAVIADFCDLINFPYQQQQGLFAVGFYTGVLPVAPLRTGPGELMSTVEQAAVDDDEAGGADADEPETDMAEQTPPPPAAPQRSATVERHHEMIDSVTIDGSVTAAGELFDVLEADAPVDGLDGTPPETVPLTVATHVPSGSAPDVPPEDDGLDVVPLTESGGFLLEDAADAVSGGSKSPGGI